MGFSLSLKLGVAPFHGWFVNVLRKLSWEFLTLASTLQKILPLYLLRLITFGLIIYVLTLSVAVSVAGRLNQLETKKLLAYSSIFSAVWMLSCERAFSAVAQYLIAYTLALIVLVSPLSFENRLGVNEVLTKNYKRKTLIYLLGFFSLGGRPPFLGFYAKVTVAQILLANSHLLFFLFLVRASVFLLYVYMRFFYQALTAARNETETRLPESFYSSALALTLFTLVVFPWL